MAHLRRGVGTPRRCALGIVPSRVAGGFPSGAYRLHPGVEGIEGRLGGRDGGLGLVELVRGGGVERAGGLRDVVGGSGGERRVRWERTRESWKGWRGDTIGGLKDEGRRRARGFAGRAPRPCRRRGIGAPSRRRVRVGAVACGADGGRVRGSTSERARCERDSPRPRLVFRVARRGTGHTFRVSTMPPAVAPAAARERLRCAPRAAWDPPRGSGRRPAPVSASTRPRIRVVDAFRRASSGRRGAPRFPTGSLARGPGPSLGSAPRASRVPPDDPGALTDATTTGVDATVDVDEAAEMVAV